MIWKSVLVDTLKISRSPNNYSREKIYIFWVCDVHQLTMPAFSVPKIWASGECFNILMIMSVSLTLSNFEGSNSANHFHTLVCLSTLSRHVSVHDLKQTARAVRFLWNMFCCNLLIPGFSEINFWMLTFGVFSCIPLYLLQKNPVPSSNFCYESVCWKCQSSLCNPTEGGRTKGPILNETKSPILETGQNRRFRKWDKTADSENETKPPILQKRTNCYQNCFTDKSVLA